MIFQAPMGEKDHSVALGQYLSPPRRDSMPTTAGSYMQMSTIEASESMKKTPVGSRIKIEDDGDEDDHSKIRDRSERELYLIFRRRKKN